MKKFIQFITLDLYFLFILFGIVMVTLMITSPYYDWEKGVAFSMLVSASVLSIFFLICLIIDFIISWVSVMEIITIKLLLTLIFVVYYNYLFSRGETLPIDFPISFFLPCRILIVISTIIYVKKVLKLGNS